MPIRTVKQGDPGSPGIINAPLTQLNQAIQRVEQVLADLEAGAFISARKTALGTTTTVGAPVYWNNQTSAFEPAFLSISGDGEYTLAASSRVQGIVVTKDTPTSGTVMLYGTKAVSLAAAIESGSGSGYYYLSSSPGKLTKTKPFVGLPVVFVTSTGQVMFPAVPENALDRHIHRKFSLACVPAGDVVIPGNGNPHSISVPDAGLPGWLPAAHASFGGLAPIGAVFGYNLAADTKLGPLWPPDPVDSCELIWNKGTDADVGGTTVPLGYTGLCIIDRNGIWWMSDCYGDVPWPINYDSSNNSTSYSDGPESECPRHLNMSLMLHTAWPLFDAANTVVTSLRSTDSRLIITCLGTTEAANKGDLEIKLDLSLGVDTADTRGATVLKGLADSTFTKGVVTEGIYSSSSNVVLASDLSPVRKIPGDNASPWVYQGLVSLTVIPQATLEIPAQLVRLESVLESYYQSIPYLEFQAGRTSTLRIRLDIPSDLVLENPQLQLKLILLGRGAGTLPTLTLTGRVLPRPTNGLITPEALPLDGDEFAIPINTTATLASANQYVEAISDAFEVTPGDTVYVTIKRISDAYTSAVGALSMAGVLSSE
jgi:hypothetical protein